VIDVYRPMVDSVRDQALYFLDRAGLIQSWNPGAEHMYGYSAPQAIGQHHSLLFLPEDRAAGVPEAQLSAAAKDAVAAAGRWVPRRDGTRFWSETSCYAVFDAQGQVTGFTKIDRDASELQRIRQTLERTNEELNRFAFVVSHDLQEPVRTMKSYGELLARRYKNKLDSDADDFLNFMTEAANRMTQLLKDLLSYSQAGRPDRTRPEPIESATVLQWAIMNVNPLVKETRAIITYDPLPAIHADQTQTAQLFQQLLTNAMRFRGSETPRIHVSASRLDGMHRFTVKDNGEGVAPEFHERIFGVFKRLHGKDVPGTGIGLSICRRIVEAHGGEIGIESSAGAGTTIYFTLPSSD
jgi:PAS domain S-box-containing protein